MKQDYSTLWVDSLLRMKNRRRTHITVTHCHSGWSSVCWGWGPPCSSQTSWCRASHTPGSASAAAQRPEAPAPRLQTQCLDLDLGKAWIKENFKAIHIIWHLKLRYLKLEQKIFLPFLKKSHDVKSSFVIVKNTCFTIKGVPKFKYTY